MRADKINLVAGTDAAAAELYPISSLPGVLAFDHQKILTSALDSLSNTVKDNPIALDLMIEPFTLSELQTVYLALGMKEHKPKGNFYRYAKLNFIDPGIIVGAGGTRSTGRQRPAKLFKLV
jgi:8-oxo-dGTP diphosphatase